MAAVRPPRFTPSESPSRMRKRNAPAHQPWSIIISSLTPYQQGRSMLQLQVSTISALMVQAMMLAPHGTEELGRKKIALGGWDHCDSAIELKAERTAESSPATGCARRGRHVRSSQLPQSVPKSPPGREMARSHPPPNSR